ncbi:hypothetical protein [Methyloversatilis sp.]|uniref:hypothetical protein n=1 Tax=Methyloversatilis sp. TaxID=2569862 RepID=UPI0027375D14|nr:hypothetical protein [Methyloversatilis sp.]MDP2867732.1 hypothetical protein [Methyloversatilis sp.]MDP3455503.1 hypothetical protein [Methyloversatilis sp.]MDP3580002.1 hypothetical protein [Methyloversatilis sp.]
MSLPDNKDELTLRLDADGRVECRRGTDTEAPAIRFDPAFFGQPESADAQRALGRFVFSLLQGMAPATNAEVGPVVDGPAALYDDFVTLQNRAMKEYSASLLEMAEKSLQQSAAAGFGQAIEAMKDWPSVRTVADMLIARGPEHPR